MALSPWDALLIGSKTLTYAATLGAAGAAWFLRYCHMLVTDRQHRRVRHIVLELAGLSLCGGAAQLLISAGAMRGTAAGMLDGSLIRLAWEAGAGRDNAIRAGGLLLVAVGVLWRRPAWPALLGAAAAATSFAWTGHVRLLDSDISPLLLGVHLLGAAFWLGALAPLLIAAGSGDIRRIAAPTARFGAAAVYVVAGMMAAGLWLLSMLLGGVAQLWSSDYGRIALSKLGLIAVLLCVAAFNKLRLTPRLLAGDASAVQSLRLSIKVEMMLGVLILAATAALTTIGGPPALD